MILSDILAAEHITDTIKGIVLYYIYGKSCIATALVFGENQLPFPCMWCILNDPVLVE